LLRDPTQWSQLLVLLALAGVYLVSLGSFDVELQRFKDAVGTLNLAFLSFVLSGVGIRMTYPMVSLEADGFWLIRTSPLSSTQIVMVKFWNALPLMLIMGMGLGIATAVFLDVSPSLAIAAPIAGLCSALVITGLGVGLGAAFPRFKATNPSEIPLSPGGLLYMTLSLAYAAIMTVLLAWPAWRTFRDPSLILWTRPEGWLFLGIVLGFTLISTALPLFYGSHRLQHFEPDDG
jgi:ABC-2 type transport system permease protein